ncbi:ribonuclease BN (tRNA processing enzyme) [Halopolyspora algeriensis]|uniref:Ribonuclease BN (tRNA processing enzyme) n=1 Tax=Halopolyspora algeriensis TaxID=1500506 RepID=A0A368W1R0_9ACTN|nr:MBL fold metallo-hydrolase [Halopolyspora algeriensis]RCW45928.1 ribonuclease BN (tRNA processing enzyme) [Halopolyspora algeriensis]TQM55341.1 ribonuclease BN (tRNA processing enzyme) [Halopolyspora algeriensis]
MCEIVTQAVQQAVSRRRLLGGAGAAALATGVTAATGTAAAAPPESAGKPVGDAEARNHRSRLTLLGTSGGPVWWPGSEREGIGSAVVVDGDVYLVDFGDGSGKRFKQAALVPPEMRTPGGFWGEEMIRAMFLTHLHSDHVADYFDYFMLGWTNGLRSRPSQQPIQVFGPGRRVDEHGNVVMEPIFTKPGESAPDIRVENPDNPVPGTVDMTDSLYQAFALDINDRMRDNRYPDLREIFTINDIAIPDGIGYHPNDNHTPQGMEPFEVYRDDKVRVTATLVDHFPLVPAFAFRFDTDDGSVVFSGDTGPSHNLVKLARGADILVHEVITQQWVDVLMPPPLTPTEEALRNHLLSAHTLPEDAGLLAEQAGVGTLVFSHIVPGNAPDEHLNVARRHFSGRLVVGRDLMEFGIGNPGR